MEAILFIGIPASGKSTFFKERFFNTHVRINLDTLKTRRREGLLVAACLGAGQQFVVDNTNVTVAERGRYISLAKASGFRVSGFYFESKIADALKRNAVRIGKECIPERGILAMHGRLEIPSLNEGFENLHYVRMGSNNGFFVEEWKDEV